MKFSIEAISKTIFSDAMAGGGKLDDAFFYAKYLKFIEASDIIEAERLFRVENDDEILDIKEEQ